MLNDGTWALAWNAENCLKCSVNGTRTLEYKYDYLSRRVEKKVIDSGTTSKYLRFVYDDYKFIEELDALNNNAIRKKVVWNGDTPFSITDIALNATFYYVLDANKNVSDLIDADGNIVAHYEYSPFGKITAQSGTYADENPLRFSSEYFDNETGFVYYNYRYYSPDLGRWLSRDPIEEDGGLNLYGFNINDAINYVDFLGFVKCEYVVYVGHGRDTEGVLDNALNNSSKCSGYSAIGCNMYENDTERAKRNNSSAKTPGTSTIDKSNTGVGGTAQTPDGNRGFNPKDIDWKKASESIKKANARKGWVALINNDWDATKKAAQKKAKNCNCECDNNKVYAKLVFVNEAARETYQNITKGLKKRRLG